MSYVTVVPEMLAAAATDVAAVGSAVGAAHLAAAAPTVALLPAAADEVSASVAHLFSQAAQDFHALAGQAAAFNQQFVQHLNASAHSYAATEAASAASLPGAAYVPGSIAALLGTGLDTLLTSLNAVATYASNFLQTLYNVVYVAVLVAYEGTLVTYLLLTDVIQLLSKMLGITLPLPLPSA